MSEQRLIDANAITGFDLSGLSQIAPYDYRGLGGYFKAQIDEAPTIDPVKHGRWDDSLDGITPYCTVCGQSHRLMTRTPAFCPSCGARMGVEPPKEDEA